MYLQVNCNGLIVIPAYQPNSTLVEIVDDLRSLISALQHPLLSILIVNDGSATPEALKVFSLLEDRPEITVLNHEINLGKGAALKTALRYAFENKFDFIVTADADGQHLPNDIIRLATLDTPDELELIIGVREFDDRQLVPAKSRIGNLLTRKLFCAIFGMNITDTQTGLRRIPNIFFEEFLKIPYDGYEFELESLISATKKKAISEISIETVYEAGNPTSHFRPVMDSLKIYFVLLRGIFVSVFISILDFTIFSLLVNVDFETHNSIVISRIISALIYFQLIRTFVFKTKGELIIQIMKFGALVAANVIILTPIIDLAAGSYDINKTLTYAVGSTLLFLLNFFLQKLFIFR